MEWFFWRGQMDLSSENLRKRIEKITIFFFDFFCVCILDRSGLAWLVCTYHTVS